MTIATVIVGIFATMGVYATIKTLADSYWDAKIEMKAEEAIKERKDTHDRRVEIAEVAKKAMIPDINGISHCFIRVGDILRGHAYYMESLERRIDVLSRRVADLEMAKAVESPEKHENHDTDMVQMEALGKSRRKHGTRA